MFLDYVRSICRNLELFSSLRAWTWIVGSAVVGFGVGSLLQQSPKRILWFGVTLGVIVAFVQGNYRAWHVLRLKTNELESNMEFRLQPERGVFTISPEAKVFGSLFLTCKSPRAATSLVFRTVTIPAFPQLQVREFTIDGQSILNPSFTTNPRQQHCEAGQTRVLEIAFRLEQEVALAAINEREELDAILELDATNWSQPRHQVLALKRYRANS